jgi:hypothetical protein
MQRLTALGLLVALFALWSCSGLSVDCVDPPEAELAKQSSLNLSIEPYPAVAGTEANFIFGPRERTWLALTGVGTSWDCWHGSTWGQPEVMAEDYDGGIAETNATGTFDTVAVPNLDLPVPGSFSIFVPEFAPGIYRLSVEVWPGSGEGSVGGFVYVEVIDG